MGNRLFFGKMNLIFKYLKIQVQELFENILKLRKQIKTIMRLMRYLLNRSKIGDLG